ncbi:MAG: RNA 2',3'-cyclic phosphodiesterase [Syntrophaceae bacterium]
MNDEKSIRSFLAVELPPEVLNEIIGIQGRLKKTLQGYISWVRPTGIHLTLKFFGNIAEVEIPNISQAVQNAIVNVKPFTLNVRRFGAFPDMKRPRVLWLGLDGDIDVLIQLQKEMDKGFQECGFQKEERTFRPHLTLARVKEPKGVIGLAKIIEKSEDYKAGSLTVSSLTLFKSELTPKGAIYTKLALFAFGG